jgi:hypothetical protein
MMAGFTELGSLGQFGSGQRPEPTTVMVPAYHIVYNHLKELK